MDLGLTGKIALVTGGSKGIGKAIAKSLASEGCKVAICARGEEDLLKVKEEVEMDGGSVLALSADLTKQEDVDHLISIIEEEFGGLDILVNNAGMTPGFYDFEKINMEDWEEIFALNVFGTVRVTKAALPLLKQRQNGRIINIGSESGVQPDGFMPEYNATKAALINLSKSWSKAFAKYGILVNTVSPAFVMTPLLENSLEQDASREGTTLEEQIQQFLQKNRPHIELKRPGKPEEVAAAVTFLSSEKSSFINGENLRVDGGSVAAQ
ncbi:SDR family NAD(P)-dependent oxidoreductase [Virgibacillus halophilus]|uniref:SDR family NAD(P)-dependent oxidoreductase n=1 Tax=Tigheibacillus halophilus TaxID=361280 RepID=UPI0036315D84